MALASVVEDLWADSQQRRSMGKAARACVVERFSVEAHVRSVVATYERVGSHAGARTDLSRL
jgi:hypothetical protein